MILGIFTGFHVLEYAQSNTVAGVSFAIILRNAVSGVEGGKPLAFIRADFQFYYYYRTSVPNDGEYTWYVNIRFRFT